MLKRGRTCQDFKRKEWMQAIRRISIMVEPPILRPPYQDGDLQAWALAIVLVARRLVGERHPKQCMVQSSEQQHKQTA